MATTKPKPKQFKVGDIVWYRTGNFTASRVRILEVCGNGGAQTYRVHIIDHAPCQSDASDVNTHHWKDGGIQVSYRSCVAMSN